MSAGWTPAETAISRSRAPAKPRAANSRSAASSRRAFVAAAFRSRRAEGALAAGGVLGRSIPRLELDHLELLEPLADARGEEAEPLHVGDDLREDELPEHPHGLALERHLEALLDRHAHALPDLLHQEAI